MCFPSAEFGLCSLFSSLFLIVLSFLCFLEFSDYNSDTEENTYTVLIFTLEFTIQYCQPVCVLDWMESFQLRVWQPLILDLGSDLIDISCFIEIIYSTMEL